MANYNQWPDYTGPDAVAQVEAEPLEHWLRGRTMVEVLDQAAADAGTGLAVRFLATPMRRQSTSPTVNLPSVLVVTRLPLLQLHLSRLSPVYFPRFQRLRLSHLVP